MRAHGVELICLAGYLRLLTPAFVARWAAGCSTSIPACCPNFRASTPIARALAAGVARHGATVHVVTEQMDAGPIVAQAEVAVLPDDTEATLAARVLAAEHRLYPEALRRYIEAASHA